MSDLVGNPEDLFSHNEAHIFLALNPVCLGIQCFGFVKYQACHLLFADNLKISRTKTMKFWRKIFFMCCTIKLSLFVCIFMLYGYFFVLMLTFLFSLFVYVQKNSGLFDNLVRPKKNV